MSVHKKYKDGLFVTGYKPEKRGVCDVLASHPEQQPMGLLPSGEVVRVPPGGTYNLGGAHLQEVVQESYEEGLAKGEVHPRVKEAIELGQTNCRKWRWDTPEDAKRDIIGSSNDYHGGSKNNFLQKFGLVKPIEIQWACHKAQSNITSRSLPSCGPNAYEAVYFHWMTERWDDFKSWNQWHETKSTMRGFMRNGAWDVVCADAKRHCDFLNNHLESDKVIAAWHQIWLIMSKCENTISQRVWVMIVRSLCRFTYPAASTGDHGYEWAVEGASKVLDFLQADMAESSIYKSSKGDAVAKPINGTDAGEGKIKKKKKGSPKDGLSVVAEEVMNPWVEEKAGVWRHVYFVEDVAKMVMSIVQHVKDEKHWDCNAIDLVLCACFKFCFKRDTQFGGKHFAYPSTPSLPCMKELRKECKNHLSRCHDTRATFEAADNIDEEPLEADAHDVEANGDFDWTILIHRVQESGFIFAITSFMERNELKSFEAKGTFTEEALKEMSPTKPKKLATTNERIQTSLKALCSQQEPGVFAKSFVRIVFELFEEDLSNGNLSTLRSLASYAREVGKLPISLAGVIDNTKELEDLLTFRSCCIRHSGLVAFAQDMVALHVR